jgi:hypothetical protein
VLLLAIAQPSVVPLRCFTSQHSCVWVALAPDSSRYAFAYFQQMLTTSCAIAGLPDYNKLYINSEPMTLL